MTLSSVGEHGTQDPFVQKVKQDVRTEYPNVPTNTNLGPSIIHALSTSGFLYWIFI